MFTNERSPLLEWYILKQFFGWIWDLSVHPESFQNGLCCTNCEHSLVIPQLSSKRSVPPIWLFFFYNYHSMWPSGHCGHIHSLINCIGDQFSFFNHLVTLWCDLHHLHSSICWHNNAWLFCVYVSPGNTYLWAMSISEPLGFSMP